MDTPDKDYFAMVKTLKESVESFKQIMNKIDQFILQKNLFQYYNQVKRLLVTTNELVSTINKTPIFFDLLKDSPEFIAADLIFCEYIQKEISGLSQQTLNIVESNENYEVLQKVEIKTSKVLNALKERLSISSFEEFKKFLYYYDNNYLLFQFFNDASTTIKTLINEKLSEFRRKEIYYILYSDFMSLLTLPFKKIEKYMDIGKIIAQQIPNEFIITTKKHKYVLTITVDELQRIIIDSVPKDLQGVSHLKLLTTVKLPEDLLNLILEKLIEDGRVIKDETVERGTIYYFPELYED